MRYVVEVAQQRNFSRAAERLHVAQQALSQQIKTVETQIGVTLFTRNNRGVELTPAGVVFVQEARRVISVAERAVTRTQAVAKGEAGSVKVAYTLTSVYDTLPAVVERVEVRPSQPQARSARGLERRRRPPPLRRQVRPCALPPHGVPGRVRATGTPPRAVCRRGQHPPTACRAPSAQPFRIRRANCSSSGRARWPPGSTTPFFRLSRCRDSSRRSTSTPPARPSGATSPKAVEWRWSSGR